MTKYKTKKWFQKVKQSLVYTDYKGRQKVHNGNFWPIFLFVHVLRKAQRRIHQLRNEKFLKIYLEAISRIVVFEIPYKNFTPNDNH
jgi:hypothetical protein